MLNNNNKNIIIIYVILCYINLFYITYYIITYHIILYLKILLVQVRRLAAALAGAGGAATWSRGIGPTNSWRDEGSR